MLDTLAEQLIDAAFRNWPDQATIAALQDHLMEIGHQLPATLHAARTDVMLSPDRYAAKSSCLYIPTGFTWRCYPLKNRLLFIDNDWNVAHRWYLFNRDLNRYSPHNPNYETKLMGLLSLLKVVTHA